jgi:hypothetical protein
MKRVNWTVGKVGKCFTKESIGTVWHQKQRCGVVGGDRKRKKKRREKDARARKKKKQKTAVKIGGVLKFLHIFFAHFH